MNQKALFFLKELQAWAGQRNDSDERREVKKIIRRSPKKRAFQNAANEAGVNERDARKTEAKQLGSRKCVSKRPSIRFS
jgi:hypothetical protein